MRSIFTALFVFMTAAFGRALKTQPCMLIRRSWLDLL